MQDIEKVIVNLIEEDSPIDLDALGGDKAIMENWDYIVISRLADEFLEILIKEPDLSSFPPGRYISDLFASVIKLNKDPLVNRNVSILTCRYPERLKDTFDQLIQMCSRKIDSFVRGHYLLAAFQISLLEKSKQYKLIAFLLEDQSFDDEAFDQYKVKILGLGYAYFNNDDLYNALEHIGNKLKDTSEQSFELGLANVKKAVLTNNSSDGRKFIEIALKYFTDPILINREDAICFAQMLSILLDFSDGSYDAEALKKRVSEVRLSLWRYKSYNTYKSIFLDMARETEMLSWWQMCDKIAFLSAKLGELGWLNPVMVIEDYLLKIYSGQKSILHVNKSGGVDYLIRPELIRKLSPLKEKLNLLEQWIATDPPGVDKNLALELIGDLERYKLTHFLGNDQGTTSGNFKDAVPAITKLSSSSFSYFNEFVASFQKESTVRIDKAVQMSFEQISRVMDGNGLKADITIWNGFSEILFRSLIFLEQRMNGTVKNYPKAGYLFKGNKVVESALQDDYFEFMLGNILSCKVTTERMDIAGGRSDVFFEFQDFFIVAEIKRETVHMGFKGYENKYLGQTLAYQATSAKLGFLFVLDLSNKGGGVGALESNISTAIFESSLGIRSGVVILRMPGNRVTPSKMKISSTNPSS